MMPASEVWGRDVRGNHVSSGQRLAVEVQQVVKRSEKLNTKFG